MTLAEALESEIASLTDTQADEACRVIGAEKLRIRRGMDWRRILLAYEMEFKVRRDDQTWGKLTILNKRLSLLLARLFRAAGHKW